MAQALMSETESLDDFQVTSDYQEYVDLLFFSSIDEATKKWLDTLQHMWALWKRCDGVSKTLTDFFETAPNPYLSTLRILVNIMDLRHIKTISLAREVLEEFSNWIKDRKEAYKEYLVPDLKIAAFKLITRQKNLQLIKMVSTIYDFMGHKETFLLIIEEMILEKKYKEAAQYAAMLQLQSHFKDPEVLVLPLILQNKLAVIDEFLVGCPEVQKSLIIYLDSLIAPGKMQTILNQYIKENKVPDVKISTAQIRPITKLVGRLIKQYNLSPELCPNLNTKRSEGALQFLLHKRYVDGSLSIASWREMIREAVGINNNLQANLLVMLVNVNDIKEGLYWAREFEIPKQQWPWAIAFAEDNAQGVNDGASTSREENWTLNENNLNYHTLKLPRNCIKVIDNGRLFEEFLDNGLKDVTMVGIDSEWKPSFGVKKSELALIQIATEENVYILDVTTLGNELSELWTELGLTLFGNRDILKIGFGVANDMTVIRNSLPALSSIKTHGQGYLDLMSLWDKLVEDYNFIFPFKGDPNFTGKSLSKLVELCFGQKLNKFDQFSNWELRPLRENQIIYAALDAYCLLEIYNVLSSYSEDMDIPFQEICVEIQHTHKSLKTNSNKSTYKKPMQSNLTMPNRSNEDYCKNIGIPLKCETAITYKPTSTSKLGYKSKYRYPQNKQNHHNKHDNHNRYDNHNRNDNHNKQDIYNRYDNQRRGNQNKQGSHNRQNNYNKEVSHNRQDDYDRQDNLLNRRDIRNGRDIQNKETNMSRSQIVQYQNPIAAHTWRVVCDSMLGGLSNRLRMCGVDCIHVLFDQGGKQSASLAMVEHRFLLTRNKNYEKFRQYIPLEKCHRVVADTPEKQLCEVLKHFAVVVTQNDIFSRCQKCNNDEFVKIPKNVMDKLVTNFLAIVAKNNSGMLPQFFQMLQFNNMPNDDDNLSDDFEFVTNPNNYFTNSEHRTWRLSTNVNDVDIETCMTKYKMRIQVDKVPLKVLDNKQVFYICEHCGKIYWDGSHLERALNGVIKDLIVNK